MKKLIKENDCDLIALTNGRDIVGYTKEDEEVDDWLELDINNDWFCVILDEE